MLIGFRFSNFRSFLTEQNFSYSTSSDRTHESTHVLETGMKAVPRISKSAIVFGANASGKSNILVALAVLRDMMLHSTAYSEAQFAERHTPFRFGPSAALPTEFEIDVLLDHVRYRYAMAYDSARILSERLLVYRTGKSQRWFDRRLDTVTNSQEWAPFSPNFNGPREMWRKATRPRALFLTTAAQLNSDQLAPLLHWAEHRLEVLFPAELSDISRFAHRLEDDYFKTRLLSMLHSVDIRVDDVRLAEQDSATVEPVDQSSRLPPRPPSLASRVTGRRSVEFLHAGADGLKVWLDSVFEASGTHRLLALFAPLINAIEEGKLLLIDEFDSGLHPLVARFVVRLINDPRISTRGAQLLLTSHNITLMDLDILRRDEIWLAEMGADQASNLVPLLRSSPRKHEMIAKNYLRGRYGAVPHIGLTAGNG